MEKNPSRSRGTYSSKTIYNEVSGRVRFHDGAGYTYNEYEYDTGSSSTFYVASRSCNDSVGYRSRDNPLILSQDNQSPLMVTADAQLRNQLDEFQGIYLDEDIHRVAEVSYGDALSGEDVSPSDTEFVTKAVAETNPSEAEFQAAAFLAELRDIGGLFKTVGSQMSKAGANEYLKFQYGWRPLVNDLKKLIRIMEKVQKRVQDVNNLNTLGTLRKMYKSQADPDVVEMSDSRHQPDYSLAIGNGLIGADVFTTMKVKRWCQTVWKPELPDNLFPSLGSGQFEKVRNAVFGGNIDGPTLWQIMPWSWLIDWNTNLSDYIESQNNTVGAKFSKAILMKTVELETRAYAYEELPFDPEYNVSYSYQPGFRKVIRKERILGITPAAVTTGGFTSILGSEYKGSILATLAIQRFR